MLAIVAVVASLAHGLEVVVGIIFRLMIQVGKRQNDPAPGEQGRVVMELLATTVWVQSALTSAFAPASAAGQDPVANPGPGFLGWVAFLVLLFDRHVTLLSSGFKISDTQVKK